MRPPRIIETARLFLRPPLLADAAVMFAQYSRDPAVTKYLTWQAHESVETTVAFLQRCATMWQQGSGFPWVVTLLHTGQFAGMVELRVREQRAEVSFAVTRPYWDCRVAPEAIQAVIDWVLQQSSIYRVSALCDVDDVWSAQVYEAVGMRCEGLLRRCVVRPNLGAESRDCWCFAIVK